MALRLRYASVPFFLLAFPVFAQIATSQYDNLRTGANLNEKIFTPKNVNTSTSARSTRGGSMVRSTLSRSMFRI